MSIHELKSVIEQDKTLKHKYRTCLCCLRIINDIPEYYMGGGVWGVIEELT